VPPDLPAWSLLFFPHPQHHCRSCSLLLCGACSSKAIALPLQHASASGPQRVCDYCFTYESRRVAFESQHRPLLATGALFLKHPHARGGAPKSRYVRVSDDRTRLVWRPAEQARAADMPDDLETSLALKQITSVRKQQPNWRGNVSTGDRLANCETVSIRNLSTDRASGALVSFCAWQTTD
jgi:hypothetical protein